MIYDIYIYIYIFHGGNSPRDPRQIHVCHLQDDLERTLRYWDRDHIVLRFSRVFCKKNFKPGGGRCCGEMASRALFLRLSSFGFFWKDGWLREQTHVTCSDIFPHKAYTLGHLFKPLRHFCFHLDSLSRNLEFSASNLLRRLLQESLRHVGFGWEMFMLRGKAANVRSSWVNYQSAPAIVCH